MPISSPKYLGLSALAGGFVTLFVLRDISSSKRPMLPIRATWGLDASKGRIEKASALWYDHLMIQLEKVYNEASPMLKKMGPMQEPAKWNRFDIMMPVVKGKVCPSLRRIGNDGDRGKLICGLDQIPASQDNPCIVYSIGSKNEWDFEEAIYDQTTCQVFTFDCTVDREVPERIRDRVQFNKICLGEPSSTAHTFAGHKYMTLKGIMSMLNHNHTTLLKTDIEGFEFPLFQQILMEEGISLPEQISSELHWGTGLKALDWYGRQKTAGEMALLATRMYEAGYRMISREDNVLRQKCTELTMVRFRCPEGPRSMSARVKAVLGY